jgi:hypothetical protein
MEERKKERGKERRKEERERELTFLDSFYSLHISISAYCGLTNYSKFRGLKIHPFIFLFRFPDGYHNL